MMSLTSDLNAIKTVQDGVKNNKVTRFAYTQTAYTNDDVDGHSDYVATRDNNIPLSDLSVIEVNQTVVDKGFRARASALNRMFLNHLFGRVSYNLNKINDLFNDLLVKIVANLGVPNGLATLDSSGRIPYTQLPEDAMEYQGDWNAQTNTPTLADGTGTKGDTYNVSVGGTQDLGSGDIVFFAGDRVIYNGSVWQRASGGNVLTVSEIAPNESDGNVDLTKQTDVRKIFNSSFLNKIYTVLSAKYWYLQDTVDTVTLAYAEDNGTYYVFRQDRRVLKSTDRINWTTVFMAEITSETATIAVSSAMAVSNGNIVIIYKESATNAWFSQVYVNGEAKRSVYLTKQSDSGDTVGKVLIKGNTIVVNHTSKGIFTSTDFGTSYTNTKAGTAFRLQYINNLFYVFSSGLKYSEDGVIWNSTNISSNTFTYVERANGIWVVGLQTGNKHPYWSNDGITWTEGTGGTSGLGYSKISYINGIWIAVSYSTSSGAPIALWSEDGKAWTRCTVDDTATQQDTNITDSVNVIYAKGVYVMNVYRNGSGHVGLYYSYDGKAWHSASATRTTSLIIWVDYADNVFLAVSEGYAFKSLDGVVWEITALPSVTSPSPTMSGQGVYKAKSQFLNYAKGIWLDNIISAYTPSGEKYINGERE
jgi:hypothetical protein